MSLENKFCDRRLFINSRVGRTELIWARKVPWGKTGGVSVWISGPVCKFLAGWAWLSSCDAITVLTWLLWRFSSKLGSLNPVSSVDWELWLHTEREIWRKTEINTQTGALIYKPKGPFSPFTEKQQFSICNETYLKNSGK